MDNQGRRPIGFPGGFTVLMATYHGDSPRLLKRALNSVICNTLVPDKVVLVVDGPIPPSLHRVIDHFTHDHGVVAAYSPDNGGLAAALNQGLKLVNTEWILRADADDFNLPNRFASQALYLQSNPTLDMFGACILEVDEQGSPLSVRRVPSSHSAIKSTMPWRNPFNHMTVAYRTKIVRDCGGYPDIHLREDYALWATLLARGAVTGNVEEVLVHANAGLAMYRRRGGWKYALGELAIQRHLVQSRVKSPLSGLGQGVMRALVFLLPAVVRGAIYTVFLRR